MEPINSDIEADISHLQERQYDQFLVDGEEILWSGSPCIDQNLPWVPKKGVITLRVAGLIGIAVSIAELMRSFRVGFDFGAHTGLVSFLHLCIMALVLVAGCLCLFWSLYAERRVTLKYAGMRYILTSKRAFAVEADRRQILQEWALKEEAPQFINPSSVQLSADRAGNEKWYGGFLMIADAKAVQEKACQVWKNNQGLKS